MQNSNRLEDKAFPSPSNGCWRRPRVCRCTCLSGVCLYKISFHFLLGLKGGRSKSVTRHRNSHSWILAPGGGTDAAFLATTGDPGAWTGILTSQRPRTWAVLSCIYRPIGRLPFL